MQICVLNFLTTQASFAIQIVETFLCNYEDSLKIGDWNANDRLYMRLDFALNVVESSTVNKCDQLNTSI